MSPGLHCLCLLQAKPFLCISPHLFHIMFLKLIPFCLIFKVLCNSPPWESCNFYASRAPLTSYSISHHTICLNTFTLIPWPPDWAESGHTLLSSSCRISASEIRGPGQIPLRYSPMLSKRERGFVFATWRLFYEVLSQYIMNSFSAFWLFLLYSKRVPEKLSNWLGLPEGKGLRTSPEKHRGN